MILLRISMACLVAVTLFVAGCHEKQKSDHETALPAGSKQVQPTKPEMHESEKVPVKHPEVGSNTQPTSSGEANAESYSSEVEADGVSYIPPIDGLDSSAMAVASSENVASVPQSAESAQIGSSAPNSTIAASPDTASSTNATITNNSPIVQNPGTVQQANNLK